MRQPKTDLSPKKTTYETKLLLSASLCQIIQLCQELPIYWHFVVVNGGLPSSYFTLLFYYCWLRLCSTPLLNGRCWNKLKYPFYPCQKCIHEEHWLFNVGQMWWFLWKYVFCVEGKWKLRLGCSSTHFWRWRGWEGCAFVLRLCQWQLASILIGVRVWHYAKADSQEHIIHLSAHVVL